jgi:hypothetical protein
MDDNVTVQDLIYHSYEQKPIEFQNAFNTLMSDKITAAVNDRKMEVAQTMFRDQQEYEEEDQKEQPDTEIESETDQEETSDGETT